MDTIYRRWWDTRYVSPAFHQLSQTIWSEAADIDNSDEEGMKRKHQGTKRGMHQVAPETTSDGKKRRTASPVTK